MKELILGGVRSGKSRLAASRASALGCEVRVIATAIAGEDEEMRRRIAAHREARPAGWRVVEEPVALARALREHAAAGRCIVVDCLTLWLSQLLFNARPETLEKERTALVDIIPSLPGSLILVANETNLGVHPMGRTARRFCDEAGITHQMVAERCQRVTLVVAGLSCALKNAAA